jgi:hypothetical protein
MHTVTLLKLGGTIPIVYAGAQYHTPLEIYLPETYPYAAPMCMVAPIPQGVFFVLLCPTSAQVPRHSHPSAIWQA